MLQDAERPLSVYPWLMAYQVPVARQTMREIAERICELRGLSLDQMRGPQRAQEIAHPRQEAMWLMYETGRWSNKQIGNFFGGKDHTTVIHGRRAHLERSRL